MLNISSPSSNLIETRGQSSFVDFSPMSIAASSDDENDVSSNVKISTASVNNRKRKPDLDDDESAKLLMTKRQLTGLVSMETFGWFKFSFSYYVLCVKLMRSNQGLVKIHSKSYSNQLLTDFCNSIPAVRSIVATIYIRIRIQISIINSIL